MNGTKEHQCKICEKVFASKQGLKNHFIVSHDQKGKVYNCNICTKAFQNQYILKSHIKTVHEQTRHKCVSCGKSFSRASCIKKHMQTVHEGNKDHKCESCSKSFSHGCNFILKIILSQVRLHVFFNLLEFPSMPKMCLCPP